MTWKILQGDVLDRLRDIPDESVQCCVTSPPYLGLRDYQVAGQIGLEDDPVEHVMKLVEVFREVRRVLRDDGICWLNYGSFYAGARLAWRRDAERGTTSTEPRDSLDGDPSCSRSGDGCEDQSSTRTLRTVQPHLESASRCEGEDLHRDEQDQERAETPTSPCAVPASTTPRSSRQPQDECLRSASNASTPSEKRTSLLAFLESARTGVDRGTLDTSGIVRTLLDHIEDTDPSLLALAYSSTVFRKFKPKDLVNMPAILAEALRLDGWWLRSDCIWHKPNPMPESVRDRPTKAHEYVFLLSKAERYFYDIEATKEAATNTAPGNTKPNKGVAEDPVRHRTRAALHTYGPVEKRNLRTVWTMTPDCYPEAHFAVFPEALAERCIMAGSRRGDVVLDPFAGSGTTLAVAERLGRDSIGIELNPAYIAMAERRIRAVDPTATVELGNGQQQKSLFGPDQ